MAPADRLMALVATFVVAAVGIAHVNPLPVGVFLDDGIYVVLAKSLATGHGYRYLNIPGEPVGTHFPPGYPLLLALLWKLSPSFPGNVGLFKIANAILLGVAAGGLALFLRFRADFSRVAAGATASLVCASVPIMILAGMVLSEPMFLAVLLPTLVAADRAAESGRARSAVLAGALLGVTILVRSIAVVALPAALLVLALRRRWASALWYLAASLVFIVPWQLWQGRHAAALPWPLQGSYGPYGPWLAAAWREQGLPYAAAVVWKNMGETLRILASFFAFGAPTWVQVAAATSAIAFVTLGAVRLWRRAPVVVAFLVCYLGLMLIWPFTPDRFLWGACTAFGAAFAAGVAAPAAWWRRARERGPAFVAPNALVLAAGLLLLASAARYNAVGYTNGWIAGYPSRAANNAAPGARWVADRTAPADLIMSDRDALIYLYTGRPAILPGSSTAAHYLRAPTPEEEAAQMQALFRAYRVRYVIAGSNAKGAERLYRARPPELLLVDTLPEGGAVLRTVK